MHSRKPRIHPHFLLRLIWIVLLSPAIFWQTTDVPAVGGPIRPETGTNGAYCLPGEMRCTAPEYAAVNFLQKELSLHDFISFRSDFLDDKKGQRTGYATKYSENTIMWCHWIGSTVQLRPELRFERAWDRKAYDNGQRQDQLTVATDLIFHF